MSRRKQMDSLRVGESVIFVGEPGQKAQKLMASIASTYRGGLNISNQGLTQSAGLTIFEGELARPAVKVTRLSPPEIKS